MAMDSQLTEARIRAMKDAGYWGERLLLDDLDHWAEVAPDRTATVAYSIPTGAREALTYAELKDKVDRLANGLIRRGIRRGDVVSLNCRTGGSSRPCTWPACASAPSATR